MNKSIVCAVAFLFLSTAVYAADEAQKEPSPVVIASNTTPESEPLPALGDEPKTEAKAKPGFVTKALIVVGAAVAAYYATKDDDEPADFGKFGSGAADSLP